MAEETIIGGRLYNLGNDYPSDVGCRPVVEGEWIASSYLDGIYTKAAEGYITGAWNTYFNTVLPHETWTSAESGHVFPDQYAVAVLATEADHVSAVSAVYPSSGIEAVIEAGVIDPEVETASPYTKSSIQKILGKDE